MYDLTASSLPLESIHESCLFDVAGNKSNRSSARAGERIDFLHSDAGARRVVQLWCILVPPSDLS